MNKKVILLDDQNEEPYQQLILTTGSNLKKLKFSCNTNNLHYLRSIRDALEIKSKCGVSPLITQPSAIKP